jgi:hypothetical protein
VKRRKAPPDDEGGDMKYLFALIGDESGWEDLSPEEMKAAMAQWTEFDRQVTEAHVFLAGEGLQPSSNATTVRIGEGDERVVTDGPFAETKEQLGGFYLLECEDLDEAIEWAKKIPMSEGVIEIRPVMDYSEYGYEAPSASVEASS